jgi:uncharacterized sulfatase
MRKRRNISRREFIKKTLVAGGVVLAGGVAQRQRHVARGRDFREDRTEALLAGVARASGDTGDNGKALPNIVLIVVDDLGYGDLGCYGNDVVATPNLDRLAEVGARLTNFLASAPLCSPSRAGMLSGRYPIRTHITMPLYPTGSRMDVAFRLAGARSYGVTGIPADELLLPELLQRRGYRTALVGKWHLGDRSPHLPNENGFDLFHGAYYSNNTEPYAIYHNDRVVVEAPADQNVLTQQLTDEATSFIRASREGPFFLYYAQPFPHAPLHASREFRGRSEAGLYGDVVAEIDWSVGRVLQTLDEVGAAENTLVLFASDNGPWWQGNPGLTRGRKNLPFEGGYRVPFIARWPGVVPAGVVRDAMCMNFDLFPTCLAAAGIDLPDDRVIDGEDMLPLLKGDVRSLHDTLYYYKGARLLGVRHHNWKYLRRHMTDNGGYASLRQGPFLFNVARDPNESYSMIESRPAIAEELSEMLDAWDAAMAENRRGWL